MALATPDVAGAIARARTRIADAGGDPARVRIVAVTKGQPPAAVAAALSCGLTDIGENYAQELLVKRAALGADAARARFHFLGGIQRNKVAGLAPAVGLWESVDRPEEGEAVARHAPGAAVLVQVRLAGGGDRGGCTPGEAPDLVERLRALGLRVEGLMGVGPAGPAEAAREGFRWLAAEARRLGLAEVSMGMSGDLEVAVQEGATMVRLGTALFGPRPGRPGMRR